PLHRRLVDETGGGTVRALGVGERRMVAGELHEGGLAQKVTEQRPMAATERRPATSRHHQELLRRHLARAQAEAVLEVAPDDRGERRVVLLEGALLGKPAGTELLQRLVRDLVRRTRRRSQGGAARTAERPGHDEADEEERRERSGRQVVGA